MIIFPSSRKEVSDRAKTDVQSQLVDSNPFLKNSFLGAIVVGFSGRIFDLYLQLKELVKQSFPNTATGDFLVRWAEWVKLSRNPATVAEGDIIVTGTIGTVIPINTKFISKESVEYNSFRP